MSLEDRHLPTPPKFVGSEITVPPFFQCSHPYTKWMLNMLRGGASFRISTMIKERPELFQQYYQIPDCPDLVRHESHDSTSMFNRHTVLFLNPLCLAIYMKKEKSAELILKSGLNSSNQKCWASEVFSRSQSGRGDLLEIYPICIAIRREYFEVIPILVHCKVKNYNISSNFHNLDVTERIEIRYENKEGKKIFRYKDALQYAIDTLKRRGNLPLSRLLELFIIDCPNSFNPFKLDEDKNGNLSSLFLRLAKVAFIEDPDCRICMQLIQCLEVLLKHRCVPWNSFTADLRCSYNGLQDSGDAENNVICKDHSSCVGILLALYNQIQKRVKNGPLDNLGYLIIKALQQTQSLPEFVKMTPEQIQRKFGKVSPDIIVPIETAHFVKRHVQAIMELEKEREFKTDLSSKSKSASCMKRYHRRSCSLVEHCEPSGIENLLQSRVISSNIVVTDYNNSQTNGRPTRNTGETSKSDDIVPLFVYQTGVNNCETQTNAENSLRDKNTAAAYEEVYLSPVPSEICEHIETAKHNLIPGFYNLNHLGHGGKNIYTFENPPFDCSDLSESTLALNGLDVTPIQRGNYDMCTENGEKQSTGRHNSIPGLCKRNNPNRLETKHLTTDNRVLDLSDMSDSNSVINCLEMTPIKPCHQLINHNYGESLDNHILQPNGDINIRQVYTKSSNNSNNFTNSSENPLIRSNENLLNASRMNYFDELDLMDELVVLSDVDESDLSAELSDKDRLVEFEDYLLDELFIEYNDITQQCINNAVRCPRNKLKTVGDIPFISKRSSKNVNSTLYNLSTEDNFNRM